MQIRQRYGKAVSIGVAVAAGILTMAMAVRPQTPVVPVGPVWEYASVIGRPAQQYGSEAPATICYGEATGCRYEPFKVTVSGTRQASEAMMAAAAKLGEKGWELAAVSTSNGEQVMHFKRLRSVLNRGDSLNAR